MNLLDLTAYEHMTPQECWERHGWGSEAIQGSTVFHLAFGETEVFVDAVDDGYGGKQACEIYDGGDMTGQWFADSPLDAIRGAVIDSIGFRTMREEVCCEDAVNVVSYRAYVRLFGPCKLFEMDVEEMDALMGIAREFVKAHVKWVDYEWEEY